MNITKESIYKKALLSLNISYDKIKDNADSVEIEYCKEYLDSAVTYCATIRPWYWLVKTVEYSEEDYDDSEMFKEFKYSYDAPKDMLYPFVVDGVYNEDYSMQGWTIYFPHPITYLSYVSETQFDTLKDSTENGVTVKTLDKKNWKYPEVYANLIATRLAVEIAPFVAPDTNVEQRCVTRMQLALQTLNKLDMEGTRKRNPNPREFVE